MSSTTLWSLVVAVLSAFLAIFVIDWDSLNWLDWVVFSISTPLALTWLVISWCNIINPNEVAKRQWFGHLEKGRLTSSNGLFGSGLHFVPWFPGIKLVRITRDMERHVFEKDPDPAVPGNIMSGTMFAVRSKDGQKMFVEASGFNRLPYDLDDSLDDLIKAGVPLGKENKEERREFIEDAIAPEIQFVFGQHNYKDVMGGQKNQELNVEINKRLQEAVAPQHGNLLPRLSLLRRVGFFGNGPDDDTPGTGEFDLKIEFVHLAGKLGESLERVATTALEAEAAKSIADKEAEETAGRIDRSVKKLVAMGDNQEEAIKFAKKQVMLDRDNYREDVSKVLVGNPDGTPFDKDAVLGPIIGGIATFFGLKKGSSGGGKNSGGGGNPGKGDGRKETTKEKLERLKKKYGKGSP